MQVRSGGVVDVPASISFTNNHQDVLVVPFEPLPANAQVQVVVSGVTDLAGNVAPDKAVQFTTAAEPDTQSPVVVRVTPFSGEVNVAVNAPIQAQVNEPIDPLTVNGSGSSFLVQDTVTGLSIPGSYTVSADGMTLSFVPGGPLPAGRRIFVFLSGTITDLAGKALNGIRLPLTAAFSPDTRAPHETGVTPSADAAAVAL